MSERDDQRLSIRDLSARTGVSIRTIRYYLAAGLLPSSGTRGKGASYTEEHLLRLQLVRRLVDQRVPLTEIRERLAALSLDELRALLAEEEAHQARLEQADRAGTPRDYVATLMERGRTTLPRELTGTLPRELTGTLPAASARRRALFDRGTPAAMPYRLESPILPSPEPGEDRQRWQVARGVELVVDRDLYAHHRQLIELLLRVVRALLSELNL